MPSARSAAAMHLYSAAAGGAVPSVLGMRLLTYTFVALIAPLAGATRDSRARAARSGPPRSPPSPSPRFTSASCTRRGVVARRAARSPRVAAAGVRDSLPGLSVRSRRPLPQARARAAGARRARVLRHRAVRPAVADIRAARPAGSRPAGHAVGGERRSSTPRCADASRGSSTPSSCTGPTTRRSGRASARRVQAHDDRRRRC